MANYTTNLKLEKPLQTESYDIDVHNANSDKLDAAIKSTNDALKKHKETNPIDHPDGSITEAKILDRNVTTGKIALGAVSNREIASKTILARNVKDDEISDTQLTATGVSAGTYNGIMVSSKGRVTSAKDNKYVGYKVSIGSGTDLNTLTQNGIYILSNYGTLALGNAPDAARVNTYGVLLVTGNEVSGIVQQYIPDSDTFNSLASYATRSYWAGSGWKAWRYVCSLEGVYPVGSIYMSVVSTNPASLFGFGTWEAIAGGRMLIGQSSAYPAGSTDGEATHKLTIAEMPSHNHYSNTGSSGNHNHTGTTSWGGDHSHNIRVITQGSDQNAGDGGNNYWSTRDTSTNGGHNHTFTTSTTGEHTHSIQNDGGGQAHNNMPPYLSVYMWKRTA